MTMTGMTGVQVTPFGLVSNRPTVPTGYSQIGPSPTHTVLTAHYNLVYHPGLHLSPEAEVIQLIKVLL